MFDGPMNQAGFEREQSPLTKLAAVESLAEFMQITVSLPENDPNRLPIGNDLASAIVNAINTPDSEISPIIAATPELKDLVDRLRIEREPQWKQDRQNWLRGFSNDTVEVIVKNVQQENPTAAAAITAYLEDEYTAMMPDTIQAIKDTYQLN